MYSISSVARMADISTHTIRAWEKRYNLNLASRNAAGRRRYSRVHAEHIALLAQLSRQGLKIGDMAQKSLDELNRLALENRLKQVSEQRPVMYLKGRQLNQLFEEHRLLFSAYLVRKLGVDPLDTLDDREAPRLILLELEAIPTEAHGSDIIEIAQRYPMSEVHVFYRFATRKVLDCFEQQNVFFIKGRPTRDSLFQLFQQTSRAHSLYIATLEKAEEALAVFRSRPEPVYSVETLEKYLDHLPKLECECPNHLSELVHQLNAFQNYTERCLESDRNDARLHQIIHDYTVYARHLMEQALTLVLQAEGVVPLEDQVELLNVFQSDRQ